MLKYLPEELEAASPVDWECASHGPVSQLPLPKEDRRGEERRGENGSEENESEAHCRREEKSIVALF